MTALIGGSLLLIAGSAIALVIGWASADESLIWTSIAASVGAAVMLSLGYYRSRAEAARRPRPREEPQTVSEAGDRTQATPAVPTGETEERVIAYADRSRFHRPGCRYAGVPGGEEITRAAAVRRGYDPCGVCKP